MSFFTIKIYLLAFLIFLSIFFKKFSLRSRNEPKCFWTFSLAIGILLKSSMKYKVSYADSLVTDLKSLDRSLVYTKNNKCPRMDPWSGFIRLSRSLHSLKCWYLSFTDFISIINKIWLLSFYISRGRSVLSQIMFLWGITFRIYRKCIKTMFRLVFVKIAPCSFIWTSNMLAPS